VSALISRLKPGRTVLKCTLQKVLSLQSSLSPSGFESCPDLFPRLESIARYQIFRILLSRVSLDEAEWEEGFFAEPVHNEVVRNREDLVRAIVAEGVRDPRLLRALRKVPRAGFVPSDLVEGAYLDRPLPITHGQVTTQPSLTAKMIEALGLTGSEHVLEVGTGYGFQTALLAYLSDFVWSVERWPDVTDTARANLARHGVTNVEVIMDDGTEGLPEHAPYEAILVSAAFPRVPSPLVEQLALGGRIVQPIGSGGEEAVILFEKGSLGLIRRRTITGARFVRLYGTHGFPE
jgi:protein-L-isoaspartate(D-aspartate) O-methyltransferase